MSYNVLARGATTYQASSHKFVFNRETLQTKFKKPLQVEHIEQTLQRYSKIKEEINNQSPDIVLLQEVDNYFFSYILKYLKEYTGYFKVFIPSDIGSFDISSKFTTAVIWKKNMFEEVECKTLDSELYYTLHQEVVKPLDRDFKKNKSLFNNKTATLVRLKEINATTETFSIVSVHLSGDVTKNNTATTETKNLLNFIFEELNKLDDTYMVIGGDINCPISDDTLEAVDNDVECYKNIKEFMTKNDFTKIKQTNAETTCDFDYSQKDDDKTVIDSIFFKKLNDTNQYLVQKLSCEDSSSSVYNSIDEHNYADIKDGSDHSWITAILSKLPIDSVKSLSKTMNGGGELPERFNTRHILRSDTPEIEAKKKSVQKPLKDFLSTLTELETKDNSLNLDDYKTKLYESLLANQTRDLFLIDNPRANLPESHRTFRGYKNDRYFEYDQLVDKAETAARILNESKS
jgi:endonuclease/exonuclease/phosphatase family metal-dependent hydrolase